MGIELIQPGDFICVSYLQPNLVEEGIAEFEAGKLKGIYVHAAGCIGGPEIVQAVARGVKYGSINDYLTPGYAKVLFCRIPMTPAQMDGCVNYWKSQVGKSYDFQGDARLALLLGMNPTCKRLNNLRAPNTARRMDISSIDFTLFKFGDALFNKIRFKIGDKSEVAWLDKFNAHLGNLLR